jgi:hypothetical protein
MLLTSPNALYPQFPQFFDHSSIFYPFTLHFVPGLSLWPVTFVTKNNTLRGCVDPNDEPGKFIKSKTKRTNPQLTPAADL